jgi:hypothetical protein
MKVEELSKKQEVEDRETKDTYMEAKHTKEGMQRLKECARMKQHPSDNGALTNRETPPEHLLELEGY